MPFGLTATEFVAYIGAAAWVPHLAQLLYKLTAKPHLSASSAPTVEIGYTAYGPIVNLTCAISTDRRDALVQKAELTVTHEKGDTRQLTWAWMSETQHEIRNLATGESAQVTKQNTAVALRVSTTALAEKLISFQDRHFITKSQPLTRAAIRRYVAIRTNALAEGSPTTEAVKALTEGPETRRRCKGVCRQRSVEGL